MKASEAHCHWRWSHDQLEVFLLGYGDKIKQDGDCVRRVKELGLPIQTAVHESPESPCPTFTLTPDAAQQFMDALWQAGLRPTEGTGSAGSLAATQKHLSDMRAIVSKHLEVPFDAIRQENR